MSLFRYTQYFERLDSQKDPRFDEAEIAVAAVCDETIGIAVGDNLDDYCNGGMCIGAAYITLADAKRLRAMLGRAIREVEKMERSNGQG